MSSNLFITENDEIFGKPTGAHIGSPIIKFSFNDYIVKIYSDDILYYVEFEKNGKTQMAHYSVGISPEHYQRCLGIPSKLRATVLSVLEAHC